MGLKVYNTLTRQKEEFQPLNPPKVGMYVCGITPYDETHVGHGRAYVTFDVIRCYLEHLGYEVTYVQNITDIDDKIINKSNELGVRSNEIAGKYTATYFEVMDKLNVKRATVYPKATDHVPEMIKWIGGLVDKGYAYVLKDGVYFEVDKDAGYGKLSGKKKEEQAAGARVNVHEGKKSPLDFALWKFAKQGEPSWPSPWGDGRPGWHIECSVMSTKYLGEQFDIHGGGLDLEFPHHENELAQTEALTGKVPWVKYWVHNGFVNVNKQKMSKSLGNFFTLKEIFSKYAPMVVRLFVLLTHYRSPIDFSDDQLLDAQKALLSIEEAIRDMDELDGFFERNTIVKKVVSSRFEIDQIKQRFLAAMDDDFNTAQALAAIFELVHLINRQVKSKEYDMAVKDLLIELLGILGLEINLSLPPTIQDLNNGIALDRAKKKYSLADQKKEVIRSAGYHVRDTTLGTITSGTSVVVMWQPDSPDNHF